MAILNLFVLAVMLAAAAPPAAAHNVFSASRFGQADTPPPTPIQEVVFPAGSLDLHGVLVKPRGDGPFPSILWNHGSEKYPGGYFAALARPFLAAGYVVFMPFRRGHGTSPGPYIVDQLAAAPRAERNRLQVQLLEDQVADQLAGLAYLQTQPFVDATRISVMGGSYGGIQTLLGAAANPGYVAAVDCSGAAQSWASNPLLQTTLESTLGTISIPIFLLAAENDYDLTPESVLGGLLEAQGGLGMVQIYPAFGTGAIGQEGHNMCFLGSSVWASDAIAFMTGGRASK
jgi:dienelactone hydrolase